MDLAIKSSATNLSKQNAVNVRGLNGEFFGIFTAKAWEAVDVVEDHVTVTCKGGKTHEFSGAKANLVGGSTPNFEKMVTLEEQ